MQKSILESLNPIWPGPFFGAWARSGGEGGGGEGERCPRPVTLNLLMVLKWNFVG